MLHPTHFGIRPQNIVEYMEIIEDKCPALPLDRIKLCCHGLSIENGSVKSLFTVISARELVDAIMEQAPPFPKRPTVNGWLQACFEAWEAREIPARPGRSNPGTFTWTFSQPWMPHPTDD